MQKYSLSSSLVLLTFIVIFFVVGWIISVVDNFYRLSLLTKPLFIRSLSCAGHPFRPKPFSNREKSLHIISAVLSIPFVSIIHYIAATTVLLSESPSRILHCFWTKFVYLWVKLKAFQIIFQAQLEMLFLGRPHPSLFQTLNCNNFQDRFFVQTQSTLAVFLPCLVLAKFNVPCFCWMSLQSGAKQFWIPRPRAWFLMPY